LRLSILGKLERLGELESFRGLHLLRRVRHALGLGILAKLERLGDLESFRRLYLLRRIQHALGLGKGCETGAVMRYGRSSSSGPS